MKVKTKQGIAAIVMFLICLWLTLLLCQCKAINDFRDSNILRRTTKEAEWIENNILFTSKLRGITGIGKYGVNIWILIFDNDRVVEVYDHYAPDEFVLGVEYTVYKVRDQRKIKGVFRAEDQ